jgi:F0F1-type ATP synthase assembly protein I
LGFCLFSLVGASFGGIVVGALIGWLIEAKLFS